MKRTPRAALYVRVSTTDQNTGLQLDEAKRLIEIRGWELAATFEDVGISGSKDRRPGLDAMLTAARRRRFDVLVVWRADRLFRSVHHMVSTLNDLAALGIEFVSCTEPFDTSPPPGSYCSISARRSLSSKGTSSSSAPSPASPPHVGAASASADLRGGSTSTPLGTFSWCFAPSAPSLARWGSTSAPFSARSVAT